MTLFFQQLRALVIKDFRREVRTKEVTTTTISFSLLLVLLFSFAFFANDNPSASVFPGVYWIAIAFTGTLAVGRTFVMEKEAGCIRVLAMVPQSWKSVYLAKLLVNLVFVLLVELVLLPFLAFVFGVSLMQHGWMLLGTSILVTVAFCAIGTLVAAMLVHNHLRDVMMPLLFYPLVIPLVIAGVQTTQRILEGEAIGHWFSVLFGIDAVALLLSIGLFRWVFESIE